MSDASPLFTVKRSRSIGETSHVMLWLPGVRARIGECSILLYGGEEHLTSAQQERVVEVLQENRLFIMTGEKEEAK